MTDHELIHLMWDNPQIANIHHPLVKNEMYGIKVSDVNGHLTKEQIKMMHDNIDPNDTPLELPDQPILKQKSSWAFPILPNTNLTKRDVFRYYSNPTIKDTIFEQIKNTSPLLRQNMSAKETFLRRPGPINRKEDLQYFIERRATEFHKIMPEYTDKIVIDVDPGEQITQEQTKSVVNYLIEFLKNQPDILDVEIQFSGNTGYYIWGTLRSKLHIDQARYKLQNLLVIHDKINNIPVTLQPTQSKKAIRLDLSSMKYGGAIKAEGSLDHRTSLMSIKINQDQLKDFDPSTDANPQVLMNKPAYSFKYEEII